MAADKTRLAHAATGLPRYYMDVGWYRHPRFAGLPVETLFVFEASVGYCHEHESSGDLPRDTEDLSLALGIKHSIVRKAVPQLLERCAFEDLGELLHIRSYEDHNPTADEIRARAEERSESGAYGNHVRHHLQKGVKSDDCKFCISESQEPAFP